MDKQHFVYAIDCGTYDANGNSLRIFGRSSTWNFYNRYDSYKTSSAIVPVLCGVIPCADYEDSKKAEAAVLNRFEAEALPAMPRSEVRIASTAVLDFIATEMIDGDEFLGMPAIEYVKECRRERTRERHAKPGGLEKCRERERKRRLCPEQRAREREYGQHYAQLPESKRKAKERAQRPETKAKRKAYNQRPDVKAKKKQKARERWDALSLEEQERIHAERKAKYLARWEAMSEEEREAERARSRERTRKRRQREREQRDNQ